MPETRQEKAERQQSMLVLSRHVGEAVIVDHWIKVMVIEIRGDRVRLGIHAPGIAIHREEIELRIADTDAEQGDGAPVGVGEQHEVSTEGQG